VENRCVIQFAIPLLYGIALGTMLAIGLQYSLPVRDAVKEFGFLIVIPALLAAIALKKRTGYNWPWEGTAEWAESRPIPMTAWGRHFAAWIVIVLLLLGGFTLWQFPGFH
jgi:hypothetical protein